MTWRLVWTRRAAKDLKRLDPPVASIFEYKHEHAVIEVLHVLGRDKAYKR